MRGRVTALANDVQKRVRRGGHVGEKVGSGTRNCGFLRETEAVGGRRWI